ncbi:DUF2934 domain-containing protein [bacterium]|nr:MAG: DUF2934 domain-containing protein [bacterium]
MAKLDIRSFGLAWGIVAAGFILLLGALNIFFYWETGLDKIMSVMGCRPTALGLVLNSVWGFAYAFIFGCAIAWIYNRVLDESREDIEKRIKETALSIWVSKGRPENTQDEDWREAQRRVRGF